MSNVPARMDLRHLRYFAVVAEEGSFHRASLRLNVVQSALSRRVLALEEELGHSLFVRKAKGVELSEHGRILLGHAQRILAEFNRSRAHMRELATGAAGILRIGLNRVAPQLLIVSEAFRAFRAGHPHVELKIQPMPSDQQLDALLRAEIDLGFMSGNPVRSMDFGYRTLVEDHFILVLPSDHRLAGTGKIRLVDLADEDFVVFSRSMGSAPYDRLMSAFAAKGVKPRIVQEGHSEDAQLGLVAAGAGIAFTYSSIVERYHRTDLVFRSVADLDVRLDIGLAWRGSDRSPLCRQFLDVIGEVVAASDRRPPPRAAAGSSKRS